MWSEDLDNFPNAVRSEENATRGCYVFLHFWVTEAGWRQMHLSSWFLVSTHELLSLKYILILSYCVFLLGSGLSVISLFLFSALMPSQ